MIQEKDFLYRVPVKTAPITTPGGQIRNPEILIDIEGGEFMHGNILDANSTNKLINQSVDNKITEGGYVTKDLLDAETARATAKENEIKAQVDIINGDSTTEGSFRKAIADVVAAAPEDLDTLKEIADKLAGNDDLHTALNQAITEKADASALLNEVARATGVENNLKATLVNYALNSDVEEKLAQKADTTMLSEFIDKTSTEEQAINSPLHAKEYISVFHNTADGASSIKITPLGFFSNQNDAAFTVCNANDFIYIKSLVDEIVRVQPTSLYCSYGTSSIDINSTGISLTNDDDNIRLGRSGVVLPGGSSNYVLTSAGSTINIAGYATKSDLNSQLGPKADRSDLIALEKKVTANTTAIEGKQDKGNYVTYSSEDGNNYYLHIGLVSSEPFAVDDSYGKNVEYGINGIVASAYSDCLATSDGSFKPIFDFVLKSEGGREYVTYGEFASVRDGLNTKQNKIIVNSVDVTDIETADAEKLRTIVTNLTNALSESGLIRLVKSAE